MKKLTLHTLQTKNVKENILRDVFVCESIAFTSSVVISSFKNTGIFPYNRQIIIDNARTALGLNNNITDQVVNELAQKLVVSISQKINQNGDDSTPLKTKKLSVKKIKLYSPSSIAEEVKKLSAAKAINEKEKLEKKEKREAKKQVKELQKKTKMCLQE